MPQGIKEKDLKGLGGTTDLSPTDGPHKQQNAWSAPASAAFDFRSMYLSYSYKSLFLFAILTILQAIQ